MINIVGSYKLSLFPASEYHIEQIRVYLSFFGTAAAFSVAYALGKQLLLRSSSAYHTVQSANSFSSELFITSCYCSKRRLAEQ